MADSAGKDGPAGRSGSDAPVARSAAAPDASSTAALRGLLDALDSWRSQRDALADAAATGLPDAPDWPELPALREFRGLWAQLRVRDQVRRALAPAPADAGPLNSGALVHRMLRLMQDQSPACLEHFTAYIDMLASLQDLQDPQADRLSAAGKATGSGARARGRKRSRARAKSD